MSYRKEKYISTCSLTYCLQKSNCYFCSFFLSLNLFNIHSLKCNWQLLCENVFVLLLSADPHESTYKGIGGCQYKMRRSRILKEDKAHVRSQVETERLHHFKWNFCTFLKQHEGVISHFRIEEQHNDIKAKSKQLSFRTKSNYCDIHIRLRM